MSARSTQHWPCALGRSLTEDTSIVSWRGNGIPSISEELGKYVKDHAFKINKSKKYILQIGKQLVYEDKKYYTLGDLTDTI